MLQLDLTLKDWSLEDAYRRHKTLVAGRLSAAMELVRSAAWAVALCKSVRADGASTAAAAGLAAGLLSSLLLLSTSRCDLR